MPLLTIPSNSATLVNVKNQILEALVRGEISLANLPEPENAWTADELRDLKQGKCFKT